MHFNGWKYKIQHLKNIASQSPAAMFSGHAVALLATAYGSAAMGSMASVAAYGVTGLSLALYVGTNSLPDNLLYKYRDIFHSRSFGKKVMLGSLDTLQRLDLNNARQALEAGLKAFKVLQSGNSPFFLKNVRNFNETPSGETLDKTLPRDYGVAHGLLVKEAIYALLTQSSLKDIDEPLPLAAQAYILQHHPEWAVLDLSQFSNTFTREVCPGLLEAVKCLQGLDFAPDEQINALRAWRAGQQLPALKPEPLPDGLI